MVLIDILLLYIEYDESIVYNTALFSPSSYLQQQKASMLITDVGVNANVSLFYTLYINGFAQYFVYHLYILWVNF